MKGRRTGDTFARVLTGNAFHAPQRRRVPAWRRTLRALWRFLCAPSPWGAR